MKYFSELAASIEPYVPGEQPQDKAYIKINTNENPYPPSPRVQDLLDSYKTEDLKLYPDPNCTKLAKAIAAAEDLSTDQIFVSNGSDEALAFAFMAFFGENKKILFPEITYSFYPVYSALTSTEYTKIPLTDEMQVKTADYLVPNQGIVIANPNAPTGLFMPLDEIEKILRYNLDNSVVIIDEAYIAFASDLGNKKSLNSQSAVRLINKYPNLLVIRTLSKSHSLAGLRVGYALGHPHLIDGLNRIKNSFNSYTGDSLAIACAAAAISDEAYYINITEQIVNTRDATAKRLRELGFSVLDSRANFLFVKCVNGKETFNYLKEKGVLVRHFDKPLINDYLRITIGTPEDMDLVVNTLAETVNPHN